MDSYRSELLNTRSVNIGHHRCGSLMEWASKTVPTRQRPKIDVNNEEILNSSSCISSELLKAIEECCSGGISGGEKKNPGMSLEADSKAYITTMVKSIWKKDDQKASLILQSKVKAASSEQRVFLLEEVNEDMEKLMDHRFGNFLIQSILETAEPAEIIDFGHRFSGEMAKWSQNQFGCHVIQKLLDVAPLVVRVKVVSELLENVVDTMTSGYGTHVWQKLIYLPWSDKLPPLTQLINSAVHLKTNDVGWSVIAQNEHGGAIVKSYLGAPMPIQDKQQCLLEVVPCIPKIILTPVGANLVSKLLQNNATRSTTINVISSNAVVYAKHPIASENLRHCLSLKFPGFSCRLSSTLGPHVYELWTHKYGKPVLTALGLEPGRSLNKKHKN